MLEVSRKKTNIFFYLLFLTAFFLLIEISFFIQCNKIYFADFASLPQEFILPWGILPGIFLFIFIQISIHFFYCVFVWLLTRLIAHSFKLSADRAFLLGIGIFLSGIITALLANQYYFPYSKFAEATAMLVFHPALTTFFLMFFCGLDIIIVVLAFSRYYLFIAAGALISLGLYLLPSQSTTPNDAASASHPNIIFIGIDALRPDFLGYFGYPISTPFLDKTLAQATIFTEAVTPLARTFPSWMSILTGQYPKQINTRTNLTELDTRGRKASLASILREQGYETIYATDETRFSNIDKHMGFDTVVSPPMGVNDFLLGHFNDFPFSNLLVNTRLGRFLFPHSYGNRAPYFVYEPDSFLQLLKPSLSKARQKPVFLAVHFTLPHLPFLWAKAPHQTSGVGRYTASLTGVDAQLQSFYQLLEANRFLEHAVVVFLSDHGEALELPGDRITEAAHFLPQNKPIPKFYPSSLSGEVINQSAGHGTDVLGLTQYRVLLAFCFYGLQDKEQKKGLVAGGVSLIDIKPTILNLLEIQADPGLAGVSLLPLIQGKQSTLGPRHLFLESDFSPPAIRSVFPEVREAMLEGIHLFEIHPQTTRVRFRTAMYQMILESKQYADIYGDWMLAFYPQSQTEQMPILVNLKTLAWTNDLNSTFAQLSPVKEMISALKSFYGNEINISTQISA